MTKPAIAERLSLSVKTVRNRVSDIFSKLHVRDRAEAIIKARKAGLDQPDKRMPAGTVITCGNHNSD